jgi:hypothetical protein
MAKNKENDSAEGDFFDQDPMRGIKRQKRKARRHRTKESLKDLTKGDEKDFELYSDYIDNFEEF